MIRNLSPSTPFYICEERRYGYFMTLQECGGYAHWDLLAPLWVMVSNPFGMILILMGSAIAVVLVVKELL